MDPLAAAEAALARGEFAEALARAGEAEASSDRRTRTQARLIRASALRAQGAQDAAEAWATRVAEEAAAGGWTELRQQGELLRAELTAGRGDAEAARTRFEALLPELTGSTLELRCRAGHAHAIRALGRVSEALDEFFAVLALARRDDDEAAEAQALAHIGGGLISAGRLTEAAEAYAQSEVRCRAQADRRTLADALMGAAEVMRIDGDFHSAEAKYREALALHQAIGSGNWVLSRMNLGLSLSERGQQEEAEMHLRAVLDAMRASGRPSYDFALRILLLPCSAARHRWEPWERDYRAATELAATAQLADADVARAAERSGRMCLEAGELDRAARSFDLALDQWRRLGRAVQAEGVVLQLRALREAGAAIPLGPFDLVKQAGEGGMGVVWRAVHRETRLPVAVKVLTREAAREELRRDLLRAEVRAMATLDHPNIALVLDHGQIGATAEAMTGGALAEGSPWLATELAVRSLEPDCGVVPWERCKAVLLDVLAGLAHAHARGVVHLDVKPANVLIIDGRAVLGDLGVSRAMVGEDEVSVAGTPGFMAPEQFVGRVRDFGPWTDLYAAGCLAVAMVSGRPPFPEDSFEGLRAAHLGMAPVIRPTIGVPAGFAAWVERLMHKAPEERFVFAADAGRALAALGPPGEAPAGADLVLPTRQLASCTFTVEVSSQTAVPDLGSDLVRQARRTGIATREAVMDLVQDHTAPPVLPPEVTPVPIVPGPPRVSAPPDRSARPDHPASPEPATAPDAPAVPRDWRAPAWPRRPAAVLAAGIGLYGMRTVPFVGRQAERDQLWRALRHVVRDRQPGLVRLHGPPGIGRSRLARWLGVRAHELGVARWLRVGPSGASLRGLLPEHGGIEARQHALGALARRAAATRALVLVVDDVHEDPDTIGLVEGLLPELADVPLLVVACARDDLLAERPAVAAAWERLAELPRVIDLALGPLDPRARRELVRELLGLEELLAAELDERTGGNPLFVVQLVSDWVQRGLLMPTERGLVLRPGAEPQLPAGLLQVWAERVARNLEGLPVQAEAGLQIAAVLGVRVDRDEWVRACLSAGVEPSPALFPRLVAVRLARAVPEGWEFEHQALREAVLGAAAAAGRLRAAYRVCAGVVSDPARRGRFLLCAGEAEAAIDPLLQAARARQDEGQDTECLALLALVDEALLVAALAADDPRRGEALCLRAGAFGELGRLDEAETDASRAVAEAYRHGWSALIPEALRQLARTLRARARWDRAEALFRQSIELFEEAQDATGASQSRHGLGLLLRRRGDLAGAADALERAIVEFDRAGQTRRKLSCLYGLGSVYQEAGELDRAQSIFDDLGALYEVEGKPWGVADALVGSSEVARQRGDLVAAQRSCESALALLDGAGAMRTLPPLINLALIRLAADDIPDARARLDEIFRARGGLGPASYRAVCAAARLAVCADADLATWEAAWESAQTEVRRAREVNRDVGWCLALAARRAEAMGHLDRARLARRLGDRGALAT